MDAARGANLLGADGSLTPLLTNLVRAKPLSAAEVQELHDLITALKPAQKPRDRRR